MNSSFQGVLHRLKSELFTAPLSYRATDGLPFAKSSGEQVTKLLYDTTVYIDGLHRKFPETLEPWFRVCEDWHSPVTEAELAYACGRLDPRHPDTANTLGAIKEVIENRPDNRILEVDREIWQEAAVLCGILVRLQQHEKSETSRLLNDALIFFTGLRNDCTVLTRNVRDFDLMLQVVPSGRVLFYQCS